ncbi:MAG: hypothetical protein QM734_12405 [Cyclobacteriaceae bacterium]
MPKIICVLAFIFSFGSAFTQSEITKWESEADTLLNHQDFSGAIALYTKIIDATKLKDKSDYKVLYKRAVSYYSSQDLEHALTDVNLFITEFPENPRPRILRALIYRHKEDVDNQLIDLQKAIDLGSENPQLIYWRGTLMLAKSEFEKAKKDLLYAKNFNDDAELETHLAMAYRSTGKSDSAFVCLNNAIVMDVNYPSTYIYASSFCIEDENYELALKYVNLGLRVEPANATVLFYKGVSLIELKRINEGCSCLRKAFEAGEDDAEGYLKEFCYDIEK